MPAEKASIYCITC